MPSAALPFTESSNPSATQVALQIPEIVLEIFSRAVTYDLPVLARVCRAFTLPAYSLLYQALSLTWHFSSLQTLLQSLDANPQLSKLVKYVEIDSTLPRGKDPHRDPARVKWIEGKVLDLQVGKDEALMMLEFLRCLQGLRHLSLQSAGLDMDVFSISPLYQRELDEVMRGLRSLKVANMTSAFWERACGSATRLDRLEVGFTSFIPSFQTRPPLRHLDIQVDDSNFVDVGNLVSGVSDTLETLHLFWMGVALHVPTFMPLDCIFDKLSHLYIDAAETRHVQTIQSLVKSAPFLRYFHWGDVNMDQYLLPLIIPHFSATVTHIDTVCYTQALASIEALMQAASQRVPTPKYFIHIYVFGFPPTASSELKNAALSQGLRFEVSDGELYDGVPCAFDIWQGEQTK